MSDSKEYSDVINSITNLEDKIEVYLSPDGHFNHYTLDDSSPTHYSQLSVYYARIKLLNSKDLEKLKYLYR